MGNNVHCEKTRSKLDESEIKFLIENTSFTREAILEWHIAFLNDCPSGRLNRKALVKTFKKLFPNGRVDKFCNQMFNVMDTDQNGFIDFLEFLTTISVLQDDNLLKKLKLVFQIYDIDQNGRLTQSEIEKSIMAIHELNGEKDKNRKNMHKIKTANIFRRFNKALGDSLTEEEFINGCLKDINLVELLVPFSAHNDERLTI